MEGEKEFIGKGVSYCALCDGPIFRDKTVAVVGGGNSGFETAGFLSNYVKKIYILEFGAQPKADQENQAIVLKTGKAEIITNAKVLKIEGDKFVKSLTYQDTKDQIREKKLNLDGVFVEIGYSPATAFVKDLVEFSTETKLLRIWKAMQQEPPDFLPQATATRANISKLLQPPARVQKPP